MSSYSSESSDSGSSNSSDSSFSRLNLEANSSDSSSSSDSQNYSSSDATDSSDSSSSSPSKSWESFISQNRKVKLISDVDSLVPDKLKELIFLMEEIIETNKETISLVFKKIEKSGESIDFTFSVVQFAFKIRPLNSEALLSLHSMLSQKYGNKNSHIKSVHKEKEMMIFKQDDLDSFIKKSSEVGFNPQSRISFWSKSPFGFVKKNRRLSYLQIMAFYGAVKCFKHACINDEYVFSDVEEYAAAGGNMEIVRILEQRNITFEKCLHVSIKFHRNELSDWILIKYKCTESSFYDSYAFFNYRALMFGFINGFFLDDAFSEFCSKGRIEIIKYLCETCHVKASYEAISIASINGHLNLVKYLYETCHAKASYNALSKASRSGNLEIVKYVYETCHAKVEYNVLRKALDHDHLDVVKYLYEICHAKVDDDVLSIASQKGYLDIVKYLYETCHAKVTYKAMNNASLNGHLDVVKYLYETCHEEVSYEAITNASRNGHLDIVKYFYETCHANVETSNKIEWTAINYASENGHLDIVKYLYETCHAEITEKTIEYAKTDEIKEYFSSKFSDKPSDFESEIYKAISKGKLTSVRYLVERYHTKLPKKVISVASSYGYLDIVEYLKEKLHVSNSSNKTKVW